MCSNLGAEETQGQILQKMLELLMAVRSRTVEMQHTQQELREQVDYLTRHDQQGFLPEVLSPANASSSYTRSIPKNNNCLIFSEQVRDDQDPCRTIPNNSTGQRRQRQRQQRHAKQQLEGFVPRSMPAPLPSMYFAEVPKMMPSSEWSPCVVDDASKPFFVCRVVKKSSYPGWGTLPHTANMAGIELFGYKPVCTFSPFPSAETFL